MRGIRQTTARMAYAPAVVRRIIGGIRGNKVFLQQWNNRIPKFWETIKQSVTNQ